MKEQYERVKIEVIRLVEEDIITTSATSTPSSSGGDIDDNEWD